MIDIDDFKKINDRYGHNAGDYVLVNVARILKDICRDSKVSRWGGEEFLILASGTISDNSALIEKLRASIEKEDFAFGEDHIKVTITAGLADYSGNDSIDRWVNVADENLYKGKKTGWGDLSWPKELISVIQLTDILRTNTAQSLNIPGRNIISTQYTAIRTTKSGSHSSWKLTGISSDFPAAVPCP